jgi:hypothetical protein
MSQLPNTAIDRALWTTPSLKSGSVGEITALNILAGVDGFSFS